MPLSNLLQIGITTHNRWDVLRKTLEQLRDFGLGDHRVLIVDDGSETPCPFDVQTVCPGAALTRHTQSAGYIPRRNELAASMTAPYFLGLDDDSFPVSGSLQDALTFLEANDRVACLSFPIFNPIRDAFQLQSVAQSPYPVRSFVGCAHVLRLSHFRQVGGYREALVRFNEERDLTARFYLSGLSTVHFPEVLFHHLETPRSRNWYAMDFYGARNNVLWNDWYVPEAQLPLKQLRTAASRMRLYATTRRAGHIKGQVAGFKSIRQFAHNRQRMSRAAFGRWQSMPSC